MEKKGQRIIFLHLPKNAGNTLKVLLKKNYDKNEIFQVGYNSNGIWNINEFLELPQQEKDNIYFLVGHFNYGIHQEFSNNFNYITMLRHPIERTISFYNFVKRQPTHRLKDAVANKSLLECVTQVRDYDVVNGQARKLSNSDDESIMLKKALENIEKHFSFVGIQEHFDESIVLLNAKLKLGIKHYQSVNEAPVKAQIDAELIREIERTNQVDLELYNILKGRFFKELETVNYKTAKLILFRTTNSLKTFIDKIKR